MYNSANISAKDDGMWGDDDDEKPDKDDDEKTNEDDGYNQPIDIEVPKTLPRNVTLDEQKRVEYS